MKLPHIIILIVFVFSSCSSVTTYELEDSFDDSYSFAESKNYDIKEWRSLDSVFSIKRDEFYSNISDYDEDQTLLAKSVIKKYEILSENYYKDYFLFNINKLKKYLTNITFTEENIKKLTATTSRITEEFYNLNNQISEKDRKIISEKIGEISASFMIKSKSYIENNLKNDFNDLKNQLNSTFKELFK